RFHFFDVGRQTVAEKNGTPLCVVTGHNPPNAPCHRTSPALLCGGEDRLGRRRLTTARGSRDDAGRRGNRGERGSDLLGRLGGEEGLGLGLFAAGAVAEGIERYGGDRGEDNAVAENRLELIRKRVEEGRRYGRDQAEADRDGDHKNAVTLL